VLGRLRVLPDYLIIGAARAGTTSLHAQIEKHPDVLPSRRQEVHYFDSLRYLNGPNYYRLFFPSRARVQWRSLRHGLRPVTGESSPYALFHPHAAQRVRDLLPDARLIVLLRDPVTRAHSDWAMRRRRGAEPLSFEDAIDQEEQIRAHELERLVADPNYESPRLRQYAYLSRGIYADQLPRWFAAFPREQLLIIQSEAYRRDVTGTLDRVWAHLGVRHVALAEYPSRNRGTYEPMADATRARLRAWFKPHDERLYALLGERYDWDNEE
jgi:Sulfotransferase domain